MKRKFITTLILVAFMTTQIFVPIVFADAKSKLGYVKQELEKLDDDYRGKILSNVWDFVVEKIGNDEAITTDEALAQIRSNLTGHWVYDKIVGDGDNQIKETTIIRLIDEILAKRGIVKAYYDTYFNTYKKYFEKAEVKFLLGLESSASAGEVYAEMMNYIVPALTHNSDRSKFVINNSIEGVKGGVARKAALVSAGVLSEESVNRFIGQREDMDEKILSLETKMNTEMSNYSLIPDDVIELLEIFGLYDKDPSAPIKISTTPVNDSTNVSRGTSIKIVFSKNILHGDNYNDISLKVSNTKLAINKIISGDTLIIRPESDLEYSTRYTVNIPAEAITDEVLRPTNKDITVTFTTQSDSGYIPPSPTPEEDKPTEQEDKEKPMDKEEPEEPEKPSEEEKEIWDIISEIDEKEIKAASLEELDKLAESIIVNLERAVELFEGIESPETVLELAKTLIEKSFAIVDKLEEAGEVLKADKFTDLLNTVAEAVLKKAATFRVEVDEENKAIVAKVKLGDVGEDELVDASTRQMLKDIISMARELTTILENKGIKSRIEPVLYIDALSGSDDISKVDLSVPSALFKTLEEEGITSVIVMTDVAVMKIQTDSITLEKNKTVLIHTEKLVKEKLSDEIKRAVGDAPVYDFFITIGGERVEFKKLIQVAIPYIPAENEDTEKTTAFYIGENGILENIIGVYDEKTGTVIFEAEHFSQYTVKLNDIRFKDVPDKFWAARYIEVMASKGVIKGVGADLFKPANSVTRAEFLAMIVREFKLFDEDAENPFEDVNETDWFYPEVVSGAKFGIVKGRPGGVFAPDDKITREEMATIVSNVLNRVLSKKAPDKAEDYLKGYADSDEIANYAKDTVAMATRYQIFSGRPDGTFAPKDNADRSEASKVIYMLFYMK